MTKEPEVLEDGSVKNGPPCPGAIQISAGGNISFKACGRSAVFVVEGRTKFKCAYGHRWLREGI